MANYIVFFTQGNVAEKVVSLSAFLAEADTAEEAAESVSLHMFGNMTEIHVTELTDTESFTFERTSNVQKNDAPKKVEEMYAPVLAMNPAIEMDTDSDGE